MSRVTSKLQVRVPRAIADKFGIKPGDEIEWQPAGESLRVLPTVRRKTTDPQARLRLFDEATRRQREREQTERVASGQVADRGWKREDLYDRGLSD